MNFGIMFFASAAQSSDQDCYHLVKEAARFADSHGFCAIWTPERHFHDFGGLFPNPAVLSAALAMITERIQIRAGSLISPLHDPIRIAEEWAVADNLSRGRVAISFGSGWNIDDFVFFPDRYDERQDVMYNQIRTVKELWGGNALARTNPAGKTVSVRILPHPVQRELPIWVTSSGNPETFKRAGAIGANLLTHLLGQDIPSLAEKIALYRDSRAQHGHQPAAGVVSLMAHTYIGADLETVKQTVRAPFREYLRSAVAIEKGSAASGGVISGGRKFTAEEIASNDMESLLDLAFDRYFQTSALLGTAESCLDFVHRIESAGVDELACLIDFGVPVDLVLTGLGWLDHLRAASAVENGAAQESLRVFAADF